MLLRLFLIDLLFETVYSETNLAINSNSIYKLECNGVELNMSNSIDAIPSGICMAFDSTDSSSYKLDCLNDGKMYRFEYASTDCSGNPSSTFLADTYFSGDYYGWSPYDNYNIVCNMEPCKYINFTTVAQKFNSSANCNQFNHNMPSNYGWSRKIGIPNYCKRDLYLPSWPTSTMWTFDGVNIKKFTYDKPDCDGDVEYVDIYNISDNNQCINDYIDISSIYIKQEIATDSSNISPPATTTTISPQLNGLLKCNGVEVNEDGTITAIPEGVCNSMDGTSFNFICNDDIMYFYAYSTKDCSGSTLLHIPADQHFGDDGINTVCNMDKCAYLDMKIYNNITFDNVNQCKMFDRDNNAADISHTYVIEKYCTVDQEGHSSMFIYDDKQIYMTEYSGNDCNDNDKMGQLNIDISTGENQCVSISSANITIAVDIISYSASSSSKSSNSMVIMIIIIVVSSVLIVAVAVVLVYIGYKKRRTNKTVANIAFAELNEDTDTVQTQA